MLHEMERLSGYGPLEDDGGGSPGRASVPREEGPEASEEKSGERELGGGCGGRREGEGD